MHNYSDFRNQCNQRNQRNDFSYECYGCYTAYFGHNFKITYVFSYLYDHKLRRLLLFINSIILVRDTKIYTS